MLFKSKQVKGVGRGKHLGFPTINLVVPDDIHIDDGIYAVWVNINGKDYKGAFHYGPTPTFDQKTKTMEVYLLDVTDDNFPNTENVPIEIDIVQYIREIKRFLDPADLIDAIAQDVEKVNKILK